MTITQLIVILISAAVTSNILLVKFMGMCSFLAISRNLRTALGLGLAVLFVTTATAPINFLIDTHLLQPRPYMATSSEKQIWVVDENAPVVKAKLAVEVAMPLADQTKLLAEAKAFYKAAVDKGAVDNSEPYEVIAAKDRATYEVPAGKAVVDITLKKVEVQKTPDLGFLQFIVYIMVIAGFVQLVEMIIERFSPVLHINLGIYLPLITVNCAILGASLDQAKDLTDLTVLSSTVYGFACGLGWMIVILLMAGIRSRLDTKSIPRPMRGLGITLVVTGLMAMAFMGFDGVDKKIKESAAAAEAAAAKTTTVVPADASKPASTPVAKGAKA